MRQSKHRRPTTRALPPHSQCCILPFYHLSSPSSSHPTRDQQPSLPPSSIRPHRSSGRTRCLQLCQPGAFRTCLLTSPRSYACTPVPLYICPSRDLSTTSISREPLCADHPCLHPRRFHHHSFVLPSTGGITHPRLTSHHPASIVGAASAPSRSARGRP